MRKLGIGLILLTVSIGYVGLLFWLVLEEAGCKQLALCRAIATVAEHHDTTGFLITLAAAVICFGVGLRLTFHRQSSEESEDTPASKKTVSRLLIGIVVLVGLCVEALFVWRIIAAENCNNINLCRSFSDKLNAVDVNIQLVASGVVLLFILFGSLVLIKRGNKEE